MARREIKKLAEEKKLQSQILDEILRLSDMTPKQLAAFLKDQGVKSAKEFDANSCPLAIHLKKKFRRNFRVESDNIQVETSDDYDMHDSDVNIPIEDTRLSAFVEAFDDGKFPFLGGQKP